MEEKKIVEINGIKMEVDMRHAKRVDHFRVGTKVKILKSGDYNDEKNVYAGIVVGFEEFKELPTIVIAYLHRDYNPKVEMLYFNKETKKVEVIIADDDYLPFEKMDVIQKMDREIEAEEVKLIELRRKKEYFITRFGSYFPDVGEKRS